MGCLPELKKWRKIHTVQDHDGHIPVFTAINEGKAHDSKFLKGLELPKSSFVIVYLCLFSPKWFLQMRENKLIFVSRMKKDMKFKLLERNEPEVSSGVSSDHVFEMGRGNKKATALKIGYYDSETYMDYVFLTNNFTLSAKIMADLRKARWQIEFFSRKSSNS